MSHKLHFFCFVSLLNINFWFIPVLVSEFECFFNIEIYSS